MLRIQGLVARSFQICLPNPGATGFGLGWERLKTIMCPEMPDLYRDVRASMRTCVVTRLDRMGAMSLRSGRATPFRSSSSDGARLVLLALQALALRDF